METNNRALKPAWIFFPKQRKPMNMGLYLDSFASHPGARPSSGALCSIPEMHRSGHITVNFVQIGSEPIVPIYVEVMTFDLPRHVQLPRLSTIAR